MEGSDNNINKNRVMRKMRKTIINEKMVIIILAYEGK